jgi:probable HAF family extracellular repeat protein
MTRLYDFRGLGFAFAICAALLSGGCVCCKPSSAVYSIRDLGAISTINGAMGSQVLNASGQVVGWSGVAFNLTASNAFRTQPNQSINPNTDDLGTLGSAAAGSNSYALSINQSGQVVGYSNTLADQAPEHAFRTTPDGATVQMTDLGTFHGNSKRSFGMGINKSGQVVGYAYVPNPGDPGNNTTNAFLTTPTGKLDTAMDLGSLGGPNNPGSLAMGINTAGQVVGYSNTGSGRHAFRTEPNASINASTDDLGLLSGGNESFAMVINDAGQVAGAASTTSGTDKQHAFRTDSSGKLISASDLGTLQGDTFSEAFAINSAGQVVGASAPIVCTGNPAGQRACFVDVGPGAKMVDLNQLIPANSGWLLREAHGINDSGQIAGWGLIGGQAHAFLLTRN